MYVLVVPSNMLTDT